MEGAGLKHISTPAAIYIDQTKLLGQTSHSDHPMNHKQTLEQELIYPVWCNLALLHILNLINRMFTDQNILVAQEQTSYSQQISPSMEHLHELGFRWGGRDGAYPLGLKGMEESRGGSGSSSVGDDGGEGSGDESVLGGGGGVSGLE